MYEKVTLKHTKRDRKVDWMHLKEAQEVVAADARALSRIFNIGSLRSAAKTHKPTLIG